MLSNQPMHRLMWCSNLLQLQPKACAAFQCFCVLKSCCRFALGAVESAMRLNTQRIPSPISLHGRQR